MQVLNKNYYNFTVAGEDEGSELRLQHSAHP